MSQATGAPERTEIELVEKAARKKRGAGMLSQIGGIAKDVTTLGQSVAKLQDEARAAEAKKDEDNARLVKLVRTGFGGKFEGSVKNNINYEEDDLAFFRSYGFNV